MSDGSMSDGSRNLRLERGAHSVWDAPGFAQSWSNCDQERWMTVALGSALTALGARRGGFDGGLLATAGAVLAVRAAMGRRDMAAARRAIDQTLKDYGWRAHDVVEDASEESFPASDAPSWTANAGATINK